MSYERLNLPRGRVLDETHLSHIENGIVELEAKASEIETVVYNEGHEEGYKNGYNTGSQHGHQEGFAEGWQQGLDEGVNIGKSQQYDEFWDIFQQNGNRTYYSHAFRSSEWTEKILKPKYPMKPAYAAYMFHSCLYSGDLTDNMQLDFSNCGNFSYIFAYASLITHIGKFDTRMATELIAAFQNASGIVTIDKIILKDDGSQVVTNMFLACSALVNVEIEGKFGNNISFSDSTKLSKASITSVINALSSTTSGKTLTLSATAKNNAFTDSEWSALIATKTNWTISLA